MINGDLPWLLGTVGNAAFTMVMLQVFTASGGRWTLVATWHATLNAVGSSFFFRMVTGDDEANLGFLLAGVYLVVAAGLYFAGGRHRALPDSHERGAVPSPGAGTARLTWQHEAPGRWTPPGERGCWTVE